MRTEEQAREYVAGKVDYTSAPVLTSGEIATCTTDALIYSARANSTAYSVGDRVAPATPSGRMYRCIVGGTSASSVPTWPSLRSAYLGQIITDGTVTWEDAGHAPKERYDLNAAIRACWMLKASKAASWVDVNNEDTDYKRSQIIKHCHVMANRYPPIYVT